MKFVPTTLLVLTLAACSPTPQAPTAAAPASAASTSAAAAPLAPSPSATAVATNAGTTLTRYHWQLRAATDKAGKRIDALFARAEQPLQLDFDARGLSVHNTCNRMHGSYSLADGKLALGMLASTMRACIDPKLAALDAAVGMYLSGTLGFDLDSAAAKPTLTLTTAQGDKLVFVGMPTAETRFGSVGETLFLEVAPQTKPCNNPGMPSAQCLEVRELQYGANGVRAGQPGPWHTLGQNIEGFTQHPGTRNVLRVKRYKIANPPADASSVAYVLDIVVESAAAQPK